MTSPKGLQKKALKKFIYILYIYIKFIFLRAEAVSYLLYPQNFLQSLRWHIGGIQQIAVD